MATRFKIVGVEVVGLGAFLLLLVILGLREEGAALGFQSFALEFTIVGGTLILVGFEILSLVKSLPRT